VSCPCSDPKEIPGLEFFGAELFGTDGVRGVANSVLTPELALGLGRAAGFLLAEHAPSPRVVIGRDTRLSGQLLCGALASGLMSIGLDVIDLGVLPTPAVAFATRELEAAGGAVISASHNPFADNGIKFFGHDGTKLNDERERHIALMVTRGSGGLPRPSGRGVGRYELGQSGAKDAYVRHVASTVTTRFDGIKVVLDCANGAAAGLAGAIFARLGAEVALLGDDPNGTNINDDCGSTHPAKLQQAVIQGGADIGFAYDGDADRVVAVDARGQLVDGDGILALVGRALLVRGELPGRTVVATVMSNLGLDAALAAAGGAVIRTPVGDRHVFAAMRERGLTLGGEQAGHIIFLDHNTTGDGLISSVQILDTLVRQDLRLDEATADLVWYPQVQVNVKFDDGSLPQQVMELPSVVAAKEAAAARLGGDGRIVMRPSGTEPLVRIMVEAADGALARQLAAQLEEVIRKSAQTLA